MVSTMVNVFDLYYCRQESDKIKRTSRFRALNASLFIIAIPVMSLAMFVTYVLTGNTLTTEKVFTVVGIFVSVRVVLTIFVPSSIMFLKEGGVSMKRIQVRARTCCKTLICLLCFALANGFCKS